MLYALAAVVLSLLTLAVHRPPPGEGSAAIGLGVFLAAVTCALAFAAVGLWRPRPVLLWMMAALMAVGTVIANAAYASLASRFVAVYGGERVIVGSELTDAGRAWVTERGETQPSDLLFSAAGDVGVMWTGDSVAAVRQQFLWIYAACLPLMALTLFFAAVASTASAEVAVGASPAVARDTILFLSADPTDAAHLRTGAEARDIHERLRLSESRDAFALEQRSALRAEDLAQALHDLRPALVHFSGHGSARGELYLEDAQGASRPVSAAALDALFREFAGVVRCVVLNACYSELQARAIARHVPVVIGMRGEIGDEAATAFAVGFYQALGAGRSVAEAYRLGCGMILLRGIPESAVPIMITAEGSDAAITLQR